MNEQSAISDKLLSDKRVIAEIDRHLWIESEKLGYDIGFENAKADWLKRFSKAWVEYHMPEVLKRAQNGNSAPVAQSVPAAKSAAVNKTPRKRHAKSYLR
ncbi:MAG TPA: hypothetical protein P5246_02955 [Candidatus Omnitrophota bacterium]|jgi:hypothetical protein|nr:hypothetical protein [Candidatus Omnitrophota bacterium]HSA30633.1 hypothetical protein [Candidatus Omnitrophota bacterium]